MEGHFLTDRGKVRNHNEDAGGLFYNKSNQLIAIIADGMGGHQAGDVASKLATESIKQKWLETDHLGGPEQVEGWLKEAVQQTNQHIFKKSQEDKRCEGMGTTVVIAVALEEYVTIAHVGDSRCYLLNEDGFQQVTEDHSFVNELVRIGQISEDDAEIHPRKNVILRALGTDNQVNVDLKTLTWQKNDRLLLCSDGLSDKVTEHELADFTDSTKDIEVIGNELIQLANNRGGEDNISLILIVHPDSSEEAGEPVE
ncbi:Stp1/IreP family PP2C-type Ser/Thr phosphatase [Oceanobacillus iheyensis]|uniref:Stp1/IreP family PP2C-type Ser/Thr phosphatase n=1 Tax=Oceanobacillus iheyensis TaxID=182710 RepID=UPI0036361268